MAGSNSPKYRTYFLTINKGAECYESVLDIIKTLKYERYALITHDKDTERVELDSGEIVWKPKKVHQHLVIELVNPISNASIQKKFAGAHVEPAKYKNASYQYLVHNRPNAKEKYQYSLDQIITNDPAQIKAIMEMEVKETFVGERALLYIAQGTITAFQFVQRFGFEQFERHFNGYDKLVQRTYGDEEAEVEFKRLLKIADQEAPF